MVFQMIDKVFTGNANKAGYLLMGYGNDVNGRIFLCYPHDDVMRLVRNNQVIGVTAVGGKFETVRGFTKPRGLSEVGKGIDLSIIKEFIRYKYGLLEITILGIKYDEKSGKVLISFSVPAGQIGERPMHPVSKVLGNGNTKTLNSNESVKLVSQGCCSVKAQGNCVLTSYLPDNVKGFKREMSTWIKKYNTDVEFVHAEVKAAPYGKSISQNILYCIDKEARQIGISGVVNKRISRILQ